LPPIVELTDVSFTAWDNQTELLAGISLSIERGEKIGITGVSGSGKTSLAHLIAGIWQMTMTGNVTGSLVYAEPRPTVGIVLQNPENQLFARTVGEEIRYGLDNPDDQWIHECLAQVGLEELEQAETHTLSHGQKQRLVIALFLVRQPDILILDEPTNNIDSVTADKLFALLEKQAGTTIIIEHDLIRLSRWADRVIVVGNGRIAAVVEGARLLEHSLFNGFANGYDVAETEKRHIPAGATPLLNISHLSCGWGKEVILKDISLGLAEGEIIALTGLNGSGKSTLLSTITGVIKPKEGSILLGGKEIGGKPAEKLFGSLGMVFQNPDYQLFESTVQRECGFGVRMLALPADLADQRLEESLTELGLWQFRERNPSSLSFGEKQRLTLASLLTAEPTVLLLDEPTTALDFHRLRQLHTLLRSIARQKGAGIIFSTHDLAFAHATADTVMELTGGTIRRIN